MNNYLIPANSKKGQLIFNAFRWEDLLVLGFGAILTLLLIVLIKDDSILLMAVKLLPLGLGVLLVYPVAYYHNVLVFIREAYNYFVSQKEFRWKGWCVTDGTEQ